METENVMAKKKGRQQYTKHNIADKTEQHEQHHNPGMM